MTEDDVRSFLDGKDEVLRRAIAEVERLVEFFIADWGNVWEFSVEQIENARIKDAPRLFAKAERKGLTDVDDLLQRCEEKDGRQRFPVHDLLGVRVLVRSLSDVAAVKRAVEELQAGKGELYPLGNSEDFDVDDINIDPRPSGTARYTSMVPSRLVSPNGMSPSLSRFKSRLSPSMCSGRTLTRELTSRTKRIKTPGMS
jgi:Region found in RelA / SpoT proteins